MEIEKSDLPCPRSHSGKRKSQDLNLTIRLLTLALPLSQVAMPGTAQGKWGCGSERDYTTGVPLSVPRPSGDAGEEAVPQKGRGQHGMEGVSVASFPIPTSRPTPSVSKASSGHLALPWPGHWRHGLPGRSSQAGGFVGLPARALPA